MPPSPSLSLRGEDSGQTLGLGLPPSSRADMETDSSPLGAPDVPAAARLQDVMFMPKLPAPTGTFSGAAPGPRVT